MERVSQRILGVVPARAGSTRIANKNIRSLGGQPLIQWTIQAARKSGSFERILVSTDSEEIATIARAAGAQVPWLRSPELATETANVVDAVLEVLALLESSGLPLPDGVMLLQPTSPFRTSDSIRGACELFARGGGRSVVSVRPTRDHPAWCKLMDARGYLESLQTGRAWNQRSQDLPPIYSVNGAIYLAAPATLKGERSFCSPQTLGFVMSSQIESLDIDTPEDWAMAEAFVNWPGGSQAVSS